MTDSSRSPASPTLPAIFERLASRGQVPSLRRTSGVFEFNFDDGGHWFLALDHGTPSVVTMAEDPTCDVHCDSSDFIAIAEGKSDMVTAYLRGDLVCTGNLAFALNFRHMVPVVA